MTAISDDRMSDEAAGEIASVAVIKYGLKPAIDERRTIAFARSAVAKFRQEFGEQGLILEMIEGARQGAEALNVETFHGVIEVVQNAEDQGASEVRLGLASAGNDRYLLLVHDGARVEFRQLVAMSYAFLSTKREDAVSTGRFGVGLKTLARIGSDLEIHCAPYHVVIERAGPRTIRAAPAIPGFYDPRASETLLRLRLSQAFDSDEFTTWFNGMGAGMLLFLNSVESLRLLKIAGARPRVLGSYRVSRPRATHVALAAGPREFRASIVQVRDQGGARWTRFTASVAVPQKLARFNKATGPTTDLSVAVAADGGAGRFYVGLPLRVPSRLPVSVNAQFDPDTARVTLQESDWNQWLLRRIAELIEAIARHELQHRPADSWRWIPLGTEVDVPGQSWLTRQLDELVGSVQAGVRRKGLLKTGKGSAGLGELAFEAAALHDLVTSADVQRLLPARQPLANTSRDPAGRWRLVLEEIGVSQIVEIADALPMFEWNDERDPAWYVSMASKALDKAISLQAHRYVVLASGERMRPPTDESGETLVAGNGGSVLAATLDLARIVHEVYLADTPECSQVRRWLEREGHLQQSVTNRQALALLGNRREALVVSDSQMLAIREALGSLRGDDRHEVGRLVGMKLLVDGYEGDPSRQPRGRRRPIQKVQPGESYLPAGIDASGKLSWPTAAAGVPGLLWIDARYRGVLRGEAGRFGARAFFGALGAEVAPRLVEPDNAETQRGVTLNRRLPDAGEMQDDAMQQVPDFWPTHLRGELISPDLDRVIAAIVALPVRKRRERAEALLSAIAEHWRVDYEPYATAEAFHFYRTWVSDGPVPTAWLSRLASQPWLSNQSHQPRSPRQLWVRSARNLDVFGDSSKHYGAEFNVLAGRYDAFLEALGITVEPHASQIIEALQDLQKSAPAGDRATADSAAGLYDALAEHCARLDGEVRRDALVDDMRVDAIRGKFGIGKGRGLVLADGEWRTPQAVFRGRRIFGSLRPFVPERRRADRLWEVLDVDLPTITDCLSVLSEIATQPPDGKAEAVLISTYRHVATLTPQRGAERDGLLRVPLWSGSEWIRTRPVFSVDDPVLGASLAGRLPTWIAPVALDALGTLPTALGVTVLDQTQFTAVGLNEEGIDRGTALLPSFRKAVGHLRARLIRRDPDTLENLTVGWPALESARVVVTSDLGVEVRIRDQPEFSIPIGAHVHRAPGQLAVCFASLEDVESEETGGRAIASLFAGDGSSRVDREKIALLWSSAWRAAIAGEVADDVDFADEVDGDEDPLSGLADELRTNIRRPNRWRGGPPARAGAPPPSGSRSEASSADQPVQEPLPLRRLKSLEGIVVLDVDVTPGTKRTRRKRGAGGGLVDPPAGGGDSGTKGSGGAAGRAYTDTERETLAVALLRRLLQTDKRVLRDLRSVGRLGADVVDDLARYFEIKTASGDMPDTVELQISQVRRSVEQRAGTWFLAVVSGLEEGFETRVRFIADPLKNLTWVEKGSLTFTGIRSAKAIDAVLG